MSARTNLPELTGQRFVISKHESPHKIAEKRPSTLQQGSLRSENPNLSFGWPCSIAYLKLPLLFSHELYNYHNCVRPLVQYSTTRGNFSQRLNEGATILAILNSLMLGQSYLCVHIRRQVVRGGGWIMERGVVGIQDLLKRGMF